MQQKRWVEGKHLHYGYTTGTCAAAASRAAAIALLSGTIPDEVTLMTPKGWELCLPVCESKMESDYACCAIRKQSGDDPDVTDGILIYATVRKTAQGIIIEGGEGIGRVTKPGLDQRVGEWAINSVPRKMIQEAVEEICNVFHYDGGICVTISAPDGSRIARETYNEKLGIVGGISILGTSGIVEPMSQQAMIDTMDAEMAVLAEEGHRELLIVLGNYGERFASDQLGLRLDVSVKCSNYVGKALELAVQHGFEKVLLIGHIGKLCKLSLGIMNTHSGEGDGRMESIMACALKAGAELSLMKQLQDCITTDAALDILQNHHLLWETMECMKDASMEYLNRKVAKQLTVEVVCFTNQPELPSILYATDGAKNLSQHFAIETYNDDSMNPFSQYEENRSKVIYEARHDGVPILLFGGTTEGRKLAEFLDTHRIPAKVFVVSDYGKELLNTDSPYISVSCGPLNEAEMVSIMKQCSPRVVVDATHPYAKQASANIHGACEKTAVPYIRLVRPSECILSNEKGIPEQDKHALNKEVGTYTSESGSCCADATDKSEMPMNSIIELNTLDEMIALCNMEQGNIYSTLGMKELQSLTGISDYMKRLYVRVLPSREAMELCDALGIPGSHRVAMQGPFSREMNLEMFRQSQASVLLTKESGKAGGFSEKLSAANQLGMKVLILRRPLQAETGLTLEEMQQFLMKLCADFVAKVQ